MPVRHRHRLAPKALGPAVAAFAMAAATLLAAPVPGGAQLYRFGKNKVQYDQFAWQRLETEHFDVYFYPEEARLASYAAHMAEASFADLERRLAHTVRRRIPLILYSSHVYFEQTNIIPGMLPEGVAGFTEFLKGRVALPLSGSYPQFERVLHHELVHVFMFDRIRTALGDRGVPDMWGGPLWFSEGLAEYLSGAADSYGDMVLRDAVLSQQLAPIAQMPKIEGTYQMYKEGESICHFLAARYGEDVFARLLANWWRGETFAEVLQVTTGESLAKLDDEWGYQLRKQYLPAIEGADPPSQMATALTHKGFNLKPEVMPAAAAADPDCLEYLCFRNDQGATDIVRARIGAGGDGGEAEAEPVVIVGERQSQYESLHPLEASLAVSPDGRQLAFVAKHNGRDHLVLWDLQRGRERRRLTFDELVALAGPTWSPDGQRLAVSGARRSGSTDLFLVDAGSGALTPLTDDLYHDIDPHWQPQGRYLAFSSDRAPDCGRRGRHSLYLYDLERRRITRLTAGDADDLQPAWSPAGDRIAYASDRGRFYNLYTLDVVLDDEGTPMGAGRRLTRALTGAFDPAWLPDGRQLLFTGYEGGRFHVYRLDPETAAADTAMADSALAARPAAADSASWTLAGLEDRGEVTRRAYRRKLSLDIAQSQISQDPVFGTSGGIQVGLSDVLGDDQYYFILSHISGSDAGFFDGLNLAFGRLHLARQLNVGWGLFRLNDRFSSTFGRFVRERRTGGLVELSYPFNRQDRFETRFIARHADIERRFEGRRLAGWLVSNHISYTHDSSLWMPTGPLDGTRYSVGLGQTVDFKTSRPFNATIFGDFRHYLRLGRRTCLAVRYMGLQSRGNVPEYFALGGSWTLRGYAFRSLWGRNLTLANHELRFPLLDRIVVAFPFGHIDLSAFRGALFADAGNAWNGSFGRWKGSLGAGVRLALGGVFVFRLDAARRTDFKSVSDDTRWEFFFGWDY